MIPIHEFVYGKPYAISYYDGTSIYNAIISVNTDRKKVTLELIRGLSQVYVCVIK